MPTKLTGKNVKGKLYVVCGDSKALESITETIKESHYVVSRAWLEEYVKNTEEVPDPSKFGFIFAGMNYYLHDQENSSWKESMTL